jgi:Leucine-rich repeat (LRR) protein
MQGFVSYAHGLNGLKILDLSGTAVSDPSVLAGLRRLQRLYLSEGPDIDLSPLSGRKDLKIIRWPRPGAAEATGEQA